MRRPAKKNGSEVGKRTERKMRARLAPIERSSASASGSLAAKPSAKAIVIGKNVTSATSSTLGVRPKPNQRIISGAMATIGSVCVVTSTGMSARRSDLPRSR